MFIGSVHNYVFFEILHRANDVLPLAVETYVRGLVNTLWVGIEPLPAATPASSSSGRPASGGSAPARRKNR
jgi:hypothetical protein